MPSGGAIVTVTSGAGRTSTGVMQIRAAAPSLFTLNQQGSGPASALDAFTFTGPPFVATQPNGDPNIIAFYGTGLGADATDLDASVNLSASVEARIDDHPVTVLYAGSAPGFVGLNQFNVVLPNRDQPGNTYIARFAQWCSEQSRDDSNQMIRGRSSVGQTIHRYR